MLDRRFCYLAGTGRTGSHWVARLLTECCSSEAVKTLHDGFMERANPAGCTDLRAFWSTYLLRVMQSAPTAESYVGCNPAILEHVALTYGIADVREAVPDPFLDRPAPVLFIVRDPVGYVESLLSREFFWNWWTYPRAQEVFDFTGWRGAESNVERLAWSWVMTNRWFLPLLGLPGTLRVRFDDLFGDVEQAAFTETVARLFEHFELEPVVSPAYWWMLRDDRENASKRHIGLSEEERETVLRICGPTMQLFWQER